MSHDWRGHRPAEDGPKRTGATAHPACLLLPEVYLTSFPLMAASSFPDNSRLVGGKPPGDIPSPEPETWEAIDGFPNQFSKRAHTKRGVGEGTPPPPIPAQPWGWPQSPQTQSEGVQGFIGSGMWQQCGSQLLLGSASSVFAQWVCRNLFESVSAALLPPALPPRGAILGGRFHS